MFHQSAFLSPSELHYVVSLNIGKSNFSHWTVDKNALGTIGLSPFHINFISPICICKSLFVFVLFSSRNYIILFL